MLENLSSRKKAMETRVHATGIGCPSLKTSKNEPVSKFGNSFMYRQKITLHISE